MPFSLRLLCAAVLMSLGLESGGAQSLHERPAALVSPAIDAPLSAGTAMSDLTRDGLAPSNPLVTASLPPYLSARSMRFVDWLADGSMLVRSRAGDTEQLHRVRVPLGQPEQLTFAAAGVATAIVQPYSSDRLIYLTAQGGGSTQLWLQQLTPGSLHTLTDGHYHDQRPYWAPDGARIALLSNRRNPTEADVYLLDPRLAQVTPRLLASGEDGAWRIYGWSADDRHLLLGRLPSQDAQNAADAGTTETELYIADADAGTLTAVGPTISDADPTPSSELRAVDARFASDGSGLLLLTRRLPEGRRAFGPTTTREYLRLIYVDPQQGSWRPLSAPTDHDVEQFTESADGHYLAYTLEDQGISRLSVVDQRLQLEQPTAAVPPGIVSDLRFDDSGQHLAFSVESTRSPADVYVLQPATGAVTRWTQSDRGLVDPATFVQPQWLQFPTWDRPNGGARQLAALVFNPSGLAPGSGAPRPVIIWLCSGPGSQCRPGFAPFVQYLVQQLGWVVIAPNVRGSVGAGGSLQSAGEGALRADAVRDVGSLLAWIGLQPGLDRNRVALMGEGFGSYLALQSLTQYSDRLLGAVAAFPPPLHDLGNVVAIQRPVLLVQGLANWAVPSYEVAQLREGLRAQGVAVQYLAASDEGADFRRKSSLDAYRVATATFLLQLLGR